MLVSDALRNFCDKVAADEYGFRVSRAFAAIGDAIANFDVGNTRVFVDHYARAGISQNRVFAEFRQDLPRCADRPFILHHVEDLSNVGWIFGYSPQSATAMEAGGLRPAADERNMRADDYVMRRNDRVRDLVDNDILKPLPKELLH